MVRGGLLLDKFSSQILRGLCLLCSLPCRIRGGFGLLSQSFVFRPKSINFRDRLCGWS